MAGSLVQVPGHHYDLVVHYLRRSAAIMEPEQSQAGHGRGHDRRDVGFGCFYVCPRPCGFLVFGSIRKNVVTAVEAQIF